VTEKLQYDMPEPLRKKLDEGLARLISSGLAAAAAAAARGGSSGAGAGPSSSSSPLEPDGDDAHAGLDSDEENEPDGDDAHAHDNPLSDYANDGLRFKTELTGIRSAVQLAWQKCPLWLGLGLP
jgi:hypothetical protein